MRGSWASRWVLVLLVALAKLAPAVAATPGSGGSEDGAVPWILGVVCDLLPTC
ncbi:MAG TPA: hypothetical protein VGR28_01665 [Candidatus Thermoplasmatota archaeon]|jgi:hypothetical protein|nr:hypothetical protein [Candidatus Thermoplasmatota archaeon]